RRLGDKTERRIKCRIISATNQNLYEVATNGLFREDLLYRLTPVVLHIPPLRQRPEDIPLLSTAFIARFNDHLNLNIKQNSPELLELLSSYNWPGNVRELEHVMESTISLVEQSASELTIADLPTFLAKRMLSNLSENKAGVSAVEKAPAGKTLTEYLRQCEADLVHKVLKLTNGNVSQSAKQLGISRQDLHYRLRRLGIKSAAYKAT
ncbi:MAG: sigma 54-interacting transcriptional regulator, partial [Sporomusa sp.]